jgi:hypothetical protein
LSQPSTVARQSGDRYTLDKQPPRPTALASEMGQFRPPALQQQVRKFLHP